MKSGFNTELVTETKEPIQRADENIPLNSFSVPGVDWQAVRANFALPNQYLRTCTLKEGTVITMCIYQTMSLSLVLFMGVLLVFFEDYTDEWWYEKFRNDLDFYYQYENLELRAKLQSLWRPFFYGIIGAHLLFFLTGWFVIYALIAKHVHPCWYLPWIIVSCILNLCHWLTCGTTAVCVVILAFYREVSVTWDIVPICLMIVYGIWWTYSCGVVIAQYKRKTIVRFWRNKRDLLGSDNYPQEVKDYLYKYAKSN